MLRAETICICIDMSHKTGSCLLFARCLTVWIEKTWIMRMIKDKKHFTYNSFQNTITLLRMFI